MFENLKSELSDECKRSHKWQTKAVDSLVRKIGQVFYVRSDAWYLFMNVCLSVCLTVSLSVYLSVCLFVCLLVNLVKAQDTTDRLFSCCYVVEVTVRIGPLP